MEHGEDAEWSVTAVPLCAPIILLVLNEARRSMISEIREAGYQSGTYGGRIWAIYRQDGEWAADLRWRR